MHTTLPNTSCLGMNGSIASFASPFVMYPDSFFHSIRCTTFPLLWFQFLKSIMSPGVMVLFREEMLIQYTTSPHPMVGLMLPVQAAIPIPS